MFGKGIVDPVDDFGSRHQAKSPELIELLAGHFIGTDPASPTGFSAYPNVNIGAELVNLTMAASSYKAAAALLSVEAEIGDSLIDILS